MIKGRAGLSMWVLCLRLLPPPFLLLRLLLRLFRPLPPLAPSSNPSRHLSMDLDLDLAPHTSTPPSPQPPHLNPNQNNLFLLLRQLTRPFPRTQKPKFSSLSPKYAMSSPTSSARTSSAACVR